MIYYLVWLLSFFVTFMRFMYIHHAWCVFILPLGSVASIHTTRVVHSAVNSVLLEKDIEMTMNIQGLLFW